MNDHIRVLLADDHAVVRAEIRQFLEHAPDIQVVAEADDGQKARALIQTDEPDDERATRAAATSRTWRKLIYSY